MQVVWCSFSWAKTTQCFEHCHKTLLDHSPHFVHVLQEPRFDPWAALSGELQLFVRPFLAS